MVNPTKYYLRTRQHGLARGVSPWSPVTVVIPPLPETPISTESQKIMPIDAALNTNFGWATAMSADGKTIVVGAYMDNSPLVDAGSAYVFDRTSTGTYVQTAKLVPNDAASNDAIGRSVDISNDGLTIAVGAFQDDDKGSNSGSAYLFVKVNGVWTQQAKVVAYDGARDDFFGYTVALSGNGLTLFVGSTQDDDNGSACGSGYVFNRNGVDWPLQAKFVPSELLAGEMFGTAADLSYDGNVLVVGAMRCTNSFLNEGAVYTFKRMNGSWTKVSRLLSVSPSYNANFGQCVKVTDDGLMMIVGAYRDDATKGSAYVYTATGNLWLYRQKLVASDRLSGDNFGISVASSIDGSVILIGAHLRAGAFAATGAAYVFKNVNGSWSEISKLTASDALKNDNFGRAVALSGNGTSGVITATGLSTTTAACYAFN